MIIIIIVAIITQVIMIITTEAILDKSVPFSEAQFAQL